MKLVKKSKKKKGFFINVLHEHVFFLPTKATEELETHNVI